ncbi:type II toxin-antitoxin system VapC family toxin [Bradyrhizobium sp.]|uniref:type II toxin-antitoxin system VapC family toxin n=1 Tax=Bradyrhizobium sp. TaxID=376 RepID=UPI002715D03D|nr:type II toxin-antitoxin system VapC family toxin [Bradyrhizobium sp.]MDO9295884.1 type II toxin-antitoxin system VapC family toxin [Bradyrhizobium sp.]
MSHYLDTSVVVALLLQDAHSSRTDTWLIREKPTILASDFCAVEFAAVVSRRVRMNRLTAETANLAFRRFDEWLSRNVQIVRCAPEHMAAAGQIVRDFTSKLSAPDAIHLAITRHSGATLATFDDRLAEAARWHAVPVMIPD